MAAYLIQQLPIDVQQGITISILGGVSSQRFPWTWSFLGFFCFVIELNFIIHENLLCIGYCAVEVLCLSVFCSCSLLLYNVKFSNKYLERALWTKLYFLSKFLVQKFTIRKKWITVTQKSIGCSNILHTNCKRQVYSVNNWGQFDVFAQDAVIDMSWRTKWKVNYKHEKKFVKRTMRHKNFFLSLLLLMKLMEKWQEHFWGIENVSFSRIESVFVCKVLMRSITIYITTLNKDWNIKRTSDNN